MIVDSEGVRSSSPFSSESSRHSHASTTATALIQVFQNQVRGAIPNAVTSIVAMTRPDRTPNPITCARQQSRTCARHLKNYRRSSPAHHANIWSSDVTFCFSSTVPEVNCATSSVVIPAKSPYITPHYYTLSSMRSSRVFHPYFHLFSRALPGSPSNIKSR